MNFSSLTNNYSISTKRVDSIVYKVKKRFWTRKWLEAKPVSERWYNHLVNLKLSDKFFVVDEQYRYKTRKRIRVYAGNTTERHFRGT